MDLLGSIGLGIAMFGIGMGIVGQVNVTAGLIFGAIAGIGMFLVSYINLKSAGCEDYRY